MPVISKSCSIPQAFNFQKDEQDRVGHINSLKISDADELKPDLNLADPEKMSERIKVVGAISSFDWDGGFASPLTLSGQISVDNKNAVITLLHKSMANTNVELEFTIYEYDPDEKKYYKCLHANGTKLKGLVQKAGSDLVLQLDDEPGMEVMQPLNYQLVLGMAPEDEAQEIHMAVSVSQKLVKQWGILRG